MKYAQSIIFIIEKVKNTASAQLCVGICMQLHEIV